jgi:hypothetical protein
VTPPERPGAVAAPVAPAEDRPMGAIYAAVIVFEIVTLLALWWFQTTFGRG